jgi:hypothetical protein
MHRAVSWTNSSSSSSSPLGVRRCTEVINLYQKLRRQQLAAQQAALGRSPSSPALLPSAGKSKAVDPSEIFREIMSKGGYKGKVEADLVKHGPTVEVLAAAVAAFQPRSMEDVMTFVKGGEEVLGQLYDERAVLKEVEWPEAKWDALREAAGLHRCARGRDM